MSTQQFAETPAAEVGSRDATGSVEVSVTAWGDYHDVYEWLLPLENRKRPPHYYLETIQSYITDAPKTQETFTKNDLELKNDGNRVVNKCLKVHGVTVMRETSKGTRYRNPAYMHYEARTQPLPHPIASDARHDHYQAWRDIPTVDAAFFAHHWGCKEKSVMNWIRDNCRPWKEQRHANRVRLARTMQTYRQWTDKTLADLLELMPMNYNTGKDIVRRFAVNDDDWQPPERPIDKTWFSQDAYESD